MRFITTVAFLTGSLEGIAMNPDRIVEKIEVDVKKSSETTDQFLNIVMQILKD